MERVFPGQLDGVIQAGNKVDVDLDEDATPALAESGAQRLKVTLQRGDKTVQILGYSGRKICVQLDGHMKCFEPLVTANGQVILSGDDFLWSSDEPAPIAGYQVKARPIGL
jgi:hypothetical protein